MENLLKDVAPGCYVVAVSGGVDSVVLLHLLMQKLSPAMTGNRKRMINGETQLIVAHYDHGIRQESAKDRLFVERLAKKYSLPFVYAEGHLGPNASEAAARAARYKFLLETKTAAGASAIITAHHLDDVLETAVINLLRGTGRRGLASLKNTPKIIRPLLKISKQDIMAFARENNLKWREDSSNQDERYLRNYVRLKILPRFTPLDRQKFLEHVENLRSLNQDIDAALSRHFEIQSSANHLDRGWFMMLSHAVARDVMASWLRLRHATFDKKLIERLVVGAKTLRPGKTVDVDNRYKMIVEKDRLALTRRER